MIPLKKTARFLVCIVVLLQAALVFTLPVSADSDPELLTYDELVELYRQEPPPDALRAKLLRLRSTPFVSNAATERGIRPLKPRDRRLGKILRVAFWNIERGLEFDAIKWAFKSPNRIAAMLDRKTHPRGSRQRAQVLAQANLMRQADVIVLNEVDWGLKRTGYRNVARDLAAELGMNYAYGVEFVEVDPISLGIETFEDAPPEDRAEFVKRIKVDPARYKGLHGSAILSRYRLDNVRLLPFDNQGYDWYKEERDGIAKIEEGRRELGEKVFLEKVTREIRRGGRMMLLADIADPELPTGKVTIVATHLENRTKPENRVKQLEELLSQIKDITNPVIIAGDMNTSTKDMTPTSVGREIKKRLGSEKFWLTQGVKYATGVGFVLDAVLGSVRMGRTQGDPTVRDIKFIAENPEAKFFDTLEKFRFSDGGAFDFRGEKNRSIGNHTRTLANSNERDTKGFVATYEVNRTIGPVGQYKLDWIFVKPPGVTHPDEKGQPFIFAPHFGRTLKELNYSLGDRISDHNPLTVDLPLGKPMLKATESATKSAQGQ
ncbi:MAG TPA: endonuclease/exonuclease/phosphatase family protein [Blastocatellia bacterium]|nr:endonuclease/exonuclease/phosphatase family protein [Blastocatellia bacterium]